MLGQDIRSAARIKPFLSTSQQGPTLQLAISFISRSATFGETLAMRAVFALLIAAAAACLAGGWSARAAGNPETVEIPRDENLKLKAVLYRPEGAGPFPAVIGL